MEDNKTEILYNKSTRRAIMDTPDGSMTIQLNEEFHYVGVVHSAPIGKDIMSKSFSNDGLVWEKKEIEYWNELQEKETK